MTAETRVELAYTLAGDCTLAVALTVGDWVIGEVPALDTSTLRQTLTRLAAAVDPPLTMRQLAVSVERARAAESRNMRSGLWDGQRVQFAEEAANG